MRSFPARANPHLFVEASSASQTGPLTRQLLAANPAAWLGALSTPLSGPSGPANNRPSEPPRPMRAKMDHIGPHGHEATNPPAHARVMYDAPLSPKREAGGPRAAPTPRIHPPGIAHHGTSIARPFRAVGRQRAHPLQAASYARGRATAHEAVKRETRCQRLPPRPRPFAVDSFGALGSSAPRFPQAHRHPLRAPHGSNPLRR